MTTRFTTMEKGLPSHYRVWLIVDGYQIEVEKIPTSAYDDLQTVEPCPRPG